MSVISYRPGMLALLAALTASAPAALLAQQELPPASAASSSESEASTATEASTTVIGTPPADLSGLPDGPDIEGFISSRTDDKLQVTTADGTSSAVLISDGTQIKGTGGFLGLSRKDIDADSLLSGLPVSVKTVRWGGGLVANEIKFKNNDLKTAAMIQSGTAQRFGQQDAAIGKNKTEIDKNAAATEALRGRLGDIDKYNVKATMNVYFDSGKADLSPRAKVDLCQAATEADAMDNALLLVVGYTDSTGSQEFNQQLSEKRASRVVNYLQQACGWKPYRMLTPTGMAESDPLASNDTEAGKAQNRRVSVNVLVSKSLDKQ